MGTTACHTNTPHSAHRVTKQSNTTSASNDNTKAKARPQHIAPTLQQGVTAGMHVDDVIQTTVARTHKKALKWAVRAAKRFVQAAKQQKLTIAAKKSILANVAGTGQHHPSRCRTN